MFSEIKKIKYLCFTLILTVLFSLSISGADAKTKKNRVYLSSIKANNVDKKFSVILKNVITSSILENYSSRYEVSGIDDVRESLKAEEFQMVIGNHDAKSMKIIGKTIKASEVIYGFISRENDKIRITLTNKKKKREASAFVKKSFVSLSCYRNQIEWYGREAGKHLINPKYRIKKTGIEKIDTTVKLGKLKIKKIMGMNIPEIQFESEDRFINVVIDDLKRKVKTGDLYYKKSDYKKANTKYKHIIVLINKKVPPKKKAKLNHFIKKINHRIQETYYAWNVTKIEKADRKIHNKNVNDVALFNRTISDYNSIITDIKSIKKIHRKKSLTLIPAIISRKNNVYTAIVNYHERSADRLYNTHKFTDAIKIYTKGLATAEKITIVKTKRVLAYQLNKKIKTAKATGKSYLSSRVSYFLDMALNENYKENTYRAKKMLKKAKMLMKKDEHFLSYETRKDYDDTASLIKEDLYETRAEIKKRQHKEKIEQKRLAAIERARKKREEKIKKAERERSRQRIKKIWNKNKDSSCLLSTSLLFTPILPGFVFLGPLNEDDYLIYYVYISSSIILKPTSALLWFINNVNDDPEKAKIACSLYFSLVITDVLLCIIIYTYKDIKYSKNSNTINPTSTLAFNITPRLNIENNNKFRPAYISLKPDGLNLCVIKRF